MSSNILTQTVKAAGGTTFTVAPPIAAGDDPVSVAVADFNGDGILDLAVVSDGDLSILLGKGDGTFQQARNFTSGVGL